MGVLKRVPAMWEGQIVTILGGGPSLLNVDPSLWRGRYRAIGVNGNWRLQPEVLFFQDYKFWSDQEHCYGIWRGYRGLAFSTAPQLIREPRVLSLDRESRSNRRTGLPEPGSSTLPMITNSGHGAICLAYLLGASRIVLLGFDARSNGNCYDNPQPAGEKTFASRFRPGIESTYEPLRERGVELVNATVGSALETIPMVTPAEALP